MHHLKQMDLNGQKIQISQAYSEQCHMPILRHVPMEVPAGTQWLWCQIYRTYTVSMMVYVWHSICAYMHGLAILKTILLCLTRTRRAKNTSTSSKNECPEEEGLKHHSLTVNRDWVINVVYLVSPSLGAYPEECSSFYIPLTYLWSSDIPEICKVSLLSFMWAIVELLIKGGWLP